jgi:hypothetical protein
MGDRYTAQTGTNNFERNAMKKGHDTARRETMNEAAQQTEKSSIV